MRKLDTYIFKKYLGTFFFAISMLILIVIIFDVSENIDSFLKHNAPWQRVVVDYYVMSIPYYIMLLLSSVSETAGTALGVRQLFHLNNLRLLVAGDDHLGDALAVAYDEILLREVYQYHTYLAAVVGVDGAGRVEDGDALLQCQAAARTHLRLVARRQLHEETRLHQSSFHRLQCNRSLEQIRPQIHARRLRRFILRQRVMGGVLEFDNHIV